MNGKYFYQPTGHFAIYEKGKLALFLLNSSVWLEMRINMALALPLFTLAGFLCSLRRTSRISLLTVVVAQLGVLLLFFVLYGFDAAMLSVMPAMLLRDGFHLHFLDIHFTNITLVILIGLGNMAILTNTASEYHHKNLAFRFR